MTYIDKLKYEFNICIADLIVNTNKLNEARSMRTDRVYEPIDDITAEEFAKRIYTKLKKI